MTFIKYYYNNATGDIWESGKDENYIVEISKEQYYAIEYARGYSNGIYRQFTSVGDFANWCSEFDLIPSEAKRAFLDMGHPMDFIKEEDIIEACRELDVNEENPHWEKDYSDGKITVDESWEILSDGKPTDLFLV